MLLLMLRMLLLVSRLLQIGEDDTDTYETLFLEANEKVCTSTMTREFHGDIKSVKKRSLPGEVIIEG
jgi:hypothetical protein